MSPKSPEEPGNQEPKIEAVPEGAADSDVALFFARHIDHPCEAEVQPGVFENIRGFYLREAERLLGTFTDPVAREMLEKKIGQYRGGGLRNSD